MTLLLASVTAIAAAALVEETMSKCRLVDASRRLIPWSRRLMLATDLTRNDQFYHAPGNSPNGAQSRWHDEGSR